MSSGPIFKPAETQRCEADKLIRSGSGGDDRDGRVYVYHKPEIELAVNVAWAANRPLLLSGPSGCGKSTLALNVALSLGWRYYEYVVTSRTEARDLLYRFDTIARLNDAHSENKLKDVAAYIEPGVLWWAFDPESARERGASGALPPEQEAADPCKVSRENVRDESRAVVLIDEIDKADIDVTNNLLVQLGSHQFIVEYTNFEVTAEHAPLIFITTNGERELPPAFVRRCVTLRLPRPTKDVLLKVARAMIPEGEQDEELFGQVAERVLSEAGPDERGAGTPPSTAEYLDTVRACLKLGIRPGDELFQELSNITLRKQQKAEGDAV
jgi:MoxR-like ATPase